MTQPACVYCQRTADDIPLIILRYRDADTWICPQHLPILIHKPEQLADVLPGVENLSPPEPH